MECENGTWILDNKLENMGIKMKNVKKIVSDNGEWKLKVVKWKIYNE